MKREIKFRGKRKLNGKWAYGSLIQIGNDWCQIIPVATEYDEIKSEMLRVISDTVGESTGLQDKNKVDVYEGDIIAQRGQANAYIEYDKCKWVLRNDEELKNGKVEWRQELHNKFHLHIEVIGNIYEHPELIDKATLNTITK